MLIAAFHVNAAPPNTTSQRTTMSEQNELDQVQDMLAHFICADSEDKSLEELSKFSIQKNVGVGLEVDAGARFAFKVRRPSVAYTADLSQSRDFAIDARLLLNTPQDIISNSLEIALVDVDVIKWSCFVKLHKRPRGIWVANSGASLYEYHSRFITASGKSDYRKRVAAIDKFGNPVKVIIEGTKNQGGTPDGLALVMASSIVEDAHRPNTFKATVRDSVGLIFPVEQGRHLEIFKLRDGPHIGSRKRPLLHLVASHIRKSANKSFDVKSHLRGVHEFEIDGFNVKLEGVAA